MNTKENAILNKFVTSSKNLITRTEKSLNTEFSFKVKLNSNDEVLVNGKKQKAVYIPIGAKMNKEQIILDKLFQIIHTESCLLSLTQEQQKHYDLMVKHFNICFKSVFCECDKIQLQDKGYVCIECGKVLQ